MKKESVVSWIESQMSIKRPFLLAFADDGVIWGKLKDEKLVTSHEIDKNISPILQELTLQEAFIFGEKEEIHVFHNEKRDWIAAEIIDGADFLTESQILWGDRALPGKDGFTPVFNARQNGLFHIVPLEIRNKEIDPGEKGDKCIRLDLHHTILFDGDTGEARIGYSRLAGLRLGKLDEMMI